MGDSIHIMYLQRGQNNWLITGDVLKQALPYGDVNAMLIPALLYGVACLLLVILVVMLIIENHREPEYYNENPYPIDEDRYLDEEYYYAEDARHDDDVRDPIPPEGCTTNQSWRWRAGPVVDQRSSKGEK